MTRPDSPEAMKAGGVALTDDTLTEVIAKPTDAATSLEIHFVAARNQGSVAVTCELHRGSVASGIIMHLPPTPDAGEAWPLPIPFVCGPTTNFRVKLSGAPTGTVYVNAFGVAMKG